MLIWCIISLGVLSAIAISNILHLDEPAEVILGIFVNIVILFPLWHLVCQQF